MNHWKLFFCLILGMLSFTACDNMSEPLEETGNEDVSVTIALSNTRYALTDHLPGESTIRSVAFHVFNEDGSRDAKTPYKYVEEEEQVFTFQVNPGKKKIIVAANYKINGWESWSFDDFSTVVTNTVITTPTGSASIAGNIVSDWNGIPMNGICEVVAEKGEIKRVDTELKRMLSRVNAPTAEGATVILSAEEKKKLEEQTGKTFGDDLRFDLNAYYVINGLSNFLVLPEYGTGGEFERWTQWISQPSYTASRYDSNGQLVSAYSGTDFLTNQKHVYLYENTPRESTLVEDAFDASTVYAFIVSADITDNATGVNATRYWRLNIAKAVKHYGKELPDYQILRNAVYKTNISRVLTAGYNTPEDAEEELPWIPKKGDSMIEAEVNVIHWMEHEGETDF